MWLLLLLVGVDSQVPVCLTPGESVSVVHAPILDMPSNSILCGIGFGNQGKLRFCTGCAIHAHSIETRTTPGFHLDTGIYVRIGPAKDVVHKALVGEFELLNNHSSEILTTTDCSPAIWNTSVVSTPGKTSSDAEEAKEVFATIKKAKAVQTPIKQSKIEDGYLHQVLFQEQTALDILDYDDLLHQSHLESYEEKLWVESANTIGQPLNPSFSLGDKLWKDTQLTNTLLEASLVFKTEQGKDREWAEQGVDEASLCITDLEKMLGSPLGDSPTVWSAISTTITSGVDSASV